MAIKNIVLNKDKLSELFIDNDITGFDLEEALDTVEKINELKKQKNAVILAHYYQRNGIKFGISDYVGDSLDLSTVAMETDADIIVFCGVNFMAESAKILNPGKKVLLPDLEAGCSLAESITAEDVRKLRNEYPDAAVVTYINTTAEIKAESDVCVTSANAPNVISKLPNKRIIFIPDTYMGKNIADEVPDKEIINWKGTCIVHEQFTEEELQRYKLQYPGIKILAHYECVPEVIKAADMHGGTGNMRQYVREHDAPSYFLATECGLASTIIAEFPEKKIIGPCYICSYMKKIELNNTLKSLEEETPEITIPEDIRVRALQSLERMFELTPFNKDATAKSKRSPF